MQPPTSSTAMIPGKVWRLVCTPFPKHDSSKTKNPMQQSLGPNTREHTTKISTSSMLSFTHWRCRHARESRRPSPSSSSICTCANKENKKPIHTRHLQPKHVPQRTSGRTPLGGRILCLRSRSRPAAQFSTDNCFAEFHIHIGFSFCFCPHESRESHVVPRLFTTGKWAGEDPGGGGWPDDLGRSVGRPVLFRSSSSSDGVMYV
jgi:hypothetical protein